MNFKALNKSELTKVSAVGNGSDNGVGTAPAQVQPSSRNGGGGGGVEPPRASYTLTRAEMPKVMGTITGLTQSNLKVKKSALRRFEL